MAATTKGKVAAAFHEVHENEPAVVASTRKKKGAEAARKQTVAIALSKARASGARVQRRPRGSPPTSDSDFSRGYRHLGKC